MNGVYQFDVVYPIETLPRVRRVFLKDIERFMKKLTQTEKCLKALQRVGSYGIHSFHLIQETGAYRVAARIDDLKDLGYVIDSVPEKLGDSLGCRYYLRSSSNVPTKKSKKVVKEFKKPVGYFDNERNVFVYS